MVHEIYKKYACPLTRVVYGLPTSWEPVVATVYNKDFCGVATWSPCNRFIAVAKSGAVEIHDAATLKLLNTLKSFPGSKATVLCFSPDSCFLTQFNDGYFITWDLQTGSSVSITFPEGLRIYDSVFSSTYSMDGKMLAVVYMDQQLQNTFIATHDLSTTSTCIYHISEGYIIPTIWTHSKLLRFATIGLECITIWEVGFTLSCAPELVKSLPVPDEIVDATRFLFLPLLSHLAICIRGTFLIWDAQASKILLRISPFFPHKMTFSSNGHFFASMPIGPQEVYVWKESPTGYTLEQKLQFATSREDTTLLLSPDGESIVVVLGTIIHLWHTKDSNFSNDPTPIVPQSNFLLEFSPVETYVAFVRDSESAVTIIDLQSGNPQLTINTGMEVVCLGVTESSLVVVGGENIVTWNLAMESSRANINDSIQIATFDPSPSHLIRSFTLMSVSPDLNYIVTLGIIQESLLKVLEINDVSTGRYLVGATLSTGMVTVYSLLIQGY